MLISSLLSVLLTDIPPDYFTAFYQVILDLDTVLHYSIFLFYYLLKRILCLFQPTVKFLADHLDAVVA